MNNSISFTHMVILKTKPWYVHAISEDDAVEICSKYGDRVVGVACSDTDISFKTVQTRVALTSPEPVKMIPEIQRREIEQLTQGDKHELPEEEKTTDSEA